MQPQYPPGPPSHPPQHPTRPAGIVLSAVALGVLASFVLLFAMLCFTVSLGGAGVPSQGIPGAPSPAAMAVFLSFFGLIGLAVAAWCVAALVGLVRMRSWARISAMVIAAGLIGLGVLSAIFTLGMRAVLDSGALPLPPALPLSSFHKVLAFMTVASILAAVLAIAWIVYLAQRRTRAAFEYARAQQLAAQQPYPPPYGYAPPAPGGPVQYGTNYGPSQPSPWTKPPQPKPNPLTDFTVARPLETNDASPVSTQPAPVPGPYAAPAWQAQPGLQPAAWPAPPPAPPRSGRPVSVTIISVFALIGAFTSLLGVISPIPGFLFGFVVSKLVLHLYSVVWAAALAIAGLGMLRLQRPAWVLALVLLGISCLNSFVLLLPGPRARYVAFMGSQGALFGASQPALPANLMAASITFGMTAALAFTVFIAFMLWRARWAFNTAPPQPAVEESETGPSST